MGEGLALVSIVLKDLTELLDSEAITALLRPEQVFDFRKEFIFAPDDVFMIYFTNNVADTEKRCYFELNGRHLWRFCQFAGKLKVQANWSEMMDRNNFITNFSFLCMHGMFNLQYSACSFTFYGIYQYFNGIVMYVLNIRASASSSDFPFDSYQNQLHSNNWFEYPHQSIQFKTLPHVNALLLLSNDITGSPSHFCFFSPYKPRWKLLRCKCVRDFMGTKSSISSDIVHSAISHTNYTGIICGRVSNWIN